MFAVKIWKGKGLLLIDYCCMVSVNASRIMWWFFIVHRFAQNEFEHGSVERGRLVFEGLMASYPKRLDLWNVYLDKEVKGGEVRAARNLLERLVSIEGIGFAPGV